jgi:putative tricarboxylic transport membrane protein
MKIASLRPLLVLLTAAALGASAQDNLRILGPAEPEAGYSTTARAVAKAMTASGAAKTAETWYAPGKGGLVGLTRFAKEARGDGAQLMVTGFTTLNSIVINKSPVTLDDVTPIARLTADVPYAFVVRAEVPVRTAQELAAMLKADPSKVAWVAGSVGGAGHTATVMFAILSGVDPTRLNFTTSLGGTAVETLLTAKATVAVASSPETYEKHVKEGRLRIVGVTSPQRRPEIDAPTFSEQGIPLVFENWRGLVAPPGITAEQRQRLSAAVDRMARSDAWKRILEENKWGDAYLGGAAFEQFLAEERTKVERAHRLASGVK